MSLQQPVNIITILWGTLYSEQDVNNLYSMIKRNTSVPITFHLFSNESLPALNSEIIQHPEPAMLIRPEHQHFSYRKEAGLCDDALGGLTGQRVFFFDLDVLITNNLDDLFAYPQDNEFYIIKDWHAHTDHYIGQATCYSFVVGTLGFIKEAFETDPAPITEKFGTASQEYLSSKIIEKFGKLNFWPEEWFQSFRFHCLPWGPLRHLLTPHKPNPGTKVLAFHGRPGIPDAIMGRWSEADCGNAAKGWKKIYKACRPTPWIQEYLQAEKND